MFEIVSTPTELIWFNIKVQHCFKVEFCGSKPHKNDDLENSDWCPTSQQLKSQKVPIYYNTSLVVISYANLRVGLLETLVFEAMVLMNTMLYLPLLTELSQFLLFHLDFFFNVLLYLWTPFLAIKSHSDFIASPSQFRAVLDQKSRENDFLPKIELQILRNNKPTL